MREDAETPGGNGTAARKIGLHAIAVAGTEIIRANPDPEIVAIEALHFRNSHPNSLKVFEGFFRPRGFRSAWPIAARTIWQNIIVPIAALLRGEVQPSARTDLPSRVDVLFISHCLDATRLPNGNDLYIGDLPRQLSDAGLTSATALVDHSVSGPRTRTSTYFEGSRILLAQSLPPSAELQITGRLLKAFAKLMSAKLVDPVQQALARYAAWQAFTPASRAALRIGDQISEIVSKLEPKAIFITFEGHSWERLAFRRARDVEPSIKCFGYAHAPLFPMHHALASDLGEGYDPDVVFVPGQAALDILQSSGETSTRQMSVLGSPRSAASVRTVTSKAAGNCLILPEGLVDEVAALLQVAVSASLELPNVKFTVRMHPALPKDLFISNKAQFGLLPPNFEWSEGRTLEEDLGRAQWALYRGSSAIISGPLMHVQPLYYRLPGEEMSIDPLFPLRGYRLVINNEFELRSALSGADLETPQDHEEALRFCGAYYQPLDADRLIKFLSPPTGKNEGF